MVYESRYCDKLNRGGDCEKRWLSVSFHDITGQECNTGVNDEYYAKYKCKIHQGVACRMRFAVNMDKFVYRTKQGNEHDYPSHKGNRHKNGSNSFEPGKFHI